MTNTTYTLEEMHEYLDISTERVDEAVSRVNAPVELENEVRYTVESLHVLVQENTE